MGILWTNITQRKTATYIRLWALSYMRRLSFSDTQSNIYTSHIHINPTYTYPLSHSHSRRYLFSRRVIFHIIIIITFIIIIISISLSQYTSCKRKLRLLFIFITCNIHTWRIQLVGGGSAISLITTIVVLVRLEIRFLRNALTVWQLRVEHIHTITTYETATEVKHHLMV